MNIGYNKKKIHHYTFKISFFFIVSVKYFILNIKNILDKFEKKLIH